MYHCVDRAPSCSGGGGTYINITSSRGKHGSPPEGGRDAREGIASQKTFSESRFESIFYLYACGGLKLEKKSLGGTVVRVNF